MVSKEFSAEFSTTETRQKRIRKFHLPIFFLNVLKPPTAGTVVSGWKQSQNNDLIPRWSCVQISSAFKIPVFFVGSVASTMRHWCFGPARTIINNNNHHHHHHHHHHPPIRYGFGKSSTNPMGVAPPTQPSRLKDLGPHPEGPSSQDRKGGMTCPSDPPKQPTSFWVGVNFPIGKSPVFFNRRYIFKVLFFQCHVRFQVCTKTMVFCCI